MAKFEPKIIGLFCKWCTSAGADLAGVSRLQYPPNVLPVQVNCSGRMDPLLILRAFEAGADGVMIGGCHIGDCHYISGNEKAKERVENTKELLMMLGIEKRRLRLEWVSASEGKRFAEVITEFVDEVREMGPNSINPINQLEKESTKERIECLQ